MRPWPLIALLPLTLLSLPLLAEDPPAPEPVTTGDWSIPVEELELILKPLTKTQLVIEADAWQAIVQEKAEQIAAGEVAVKRQNAEITEAESIREQAELAKQKLKEVEEKASEAAASGDTKAAEEVRETAEDAKAEMLEVQQQIEAAADAAERTAEIREHVADISGRSMEQAAGVKGQGGEQTADAAGDAADQVDEVTAAVDEAVARAQGGGEMSETADDVRRQAGEAVAATEVVSAAARRAATATEQAEAEAEAAAEAPDDAEDQPELLARAAELASAEEAKREEKRALLEAVTKMREERKQLLDRFKAVLAALEAKTPEDDTETLALIADHRLYVRAVSGVEVDVEDTTSAWIAAKGWVTSEEGGIRLAVNLVRFFGVLIAAWFVAKLFSAAIHRGLRRVKGTSRLLEDFLVKTVRWVVMAIGIIMALASLEISVGPLLAVIGAAGFVVAFALQDSLSNFASGLMILIFRPFDVGDVVDAGGVSGTVKSMNLISTTIKTFDNKTMVVPNNMISGDVITNATGVRERRVDMEFGIAYDADIDRAQIILEEIITTHPKVLEEPAPTIALNALGDNSVNFIARPWTRTADYWEVFWDVTKAVKKRFDAEGIGIPFPQRDVHLYIEGGAEQLLAKQSPTNATAAPGTNAEG
jgi:small conductance mechanosensitive channel